jgi:hypothetical protein
MVPSRVMRPPVVACASEAHLCSVAAASSGGQSAKKRRSLPSDLLFFWYADWLEPRTGRRVFKLNLQD